MDVSETPRGKQPGEPQGCRDPSSQSSNTNSGNVCNVYDIHDVIVLRLKNIGNYKNRGRAGFPPRGRPANMRLVFVLLL